MLIIEPCAGLSNRILALATAYNLAKDYRHKVTLLWDVDNTVGAKIQSLFLLPADIKIITMTKAPWHRKFILRLKSEVLRWWYRKTCDIFLDCGEIEANKRSDDQNAIREVFREYQTIYIKAFCELECIRDKRIFSIFQTSPAIFDKGKEVFEHIDELTMGMHIRRTDHIEALDKSPLDLFIKKAEILLDSSDKITIYLATDDKLVEEAMREYFGKRILYYKGKTYSRKNQSGMEDSIIDMLALSRCKEIYGSFGSTFSLMASYIGNKELIILQKE